MNFTSIGTIKTYKAKFINKNCAIFKELYRLLSFEQIDYWYGL